MGSELLRIAEGFSIVAEGLRGLAKAEGGSKTAEKTQKAQPSATEKAQKQDAAQEQPATLEGIRALMAQKTQESEVLRDKEIIEEQLKKERGSPPCRRTGNFQKNRWINMCQG